MCFGCCVHSRTWCKAFTKIERALVILQLFLVAIFLVFLIFIILHFVACNDKSGKNIVYHTTTLHTTVPHEDFHTSEYVGTYINNSTEEINTTLATPSYMSNVTEADNITENIEQHTNEEVTVSTTKQPLNGSTKVKCTWKPFQKTVAENRYFLNDSIKFVSKTADETIKKDSVFIFKHVKDLSNNTHFVCTLTAISKSWLITAASCVQNITNISSIYNYSILNINGTKRCMVADVQLHPLHRTSPVYDVAALRSDQEVVSEGVKLGTVLDYLLLTLGERLTVLRYGHIGTIESEEMDHQLSSEPVYKVPLSWCTRRGRHLWPSRVTGGMTRGLCAGHPRGQAEGRQTCGEAGGGAPVFLRGALLAVTIGHHQCSPDMLGIVPAVRLWLDQLVR